MLTMTVTVIIVIVNVAVFGLKGPTFATGRVFDDDSIMQYCIAFITRGKYTLKARMKCITILVLTNRLSNNLDDLERSMKMVST